jgi:hypothetical protein
MIGQRSTRPTKPGEAEPTFVRNLGRLLQLIGLAVPPLSIILQLTEAISLGQMLTMLVASVCSFGIGRILEGYAR